MLTERARGGTPSSPLETATARAAGQSWAAQSCRAPRLLTQTRPLAPSTEELQCSLKRGGQGAALLFSANGRPSSWILHISVPRPPC